MNDFINELGVIIYATLLFTPPLLFAALVLGFCNTAKTEYRIS